jgi:inosine-uridine preferring nucleoside hydrolase
VEPLPSTPGAALDLLAVSAEAGATIVAIGPYTNLALLQAARPGLLASVRVVVMGGYIRPSGPGLASWGSEMDYNVQQDVAAARIVWERCAPILVQFSVCLGGTCAGCTYRGSGRAAGLPASSPTRASCTGRRRAWEGRAASSRAAGRPPQLPLRSAGVRSGRRLGRRHGGGVGAGGPTRRRRVACLPRGTRRQEDARRHGSRRPPLRGGVAESGGIGGIGRLES